MATTKITPKFEIYKQETPAPTFRRRFHKVRERQTLFGVKNVVRLEEEGTPIPVEEAYDVYLPNGNSVRIISRQEAIRLGILDKPKMVDLVSGEEVPPNYEVGSLRDKAQLLEAVQRRSKTFRGE
jgi:hypothetical protein